MILEHLLKNERQYITFATSARCAAQKSMKTYGFSMFLSFHSQSRPAQPVRRLADWLDGWMAGWLADWLAGWLDACMAGCLYDWMTGWLCGWMAGWLDGW